LSEDTNLADGLSFSSVITDDNGKFKEIISSAHDTSGNGDFTAIPTAGISVGERNYIHYMQIRQWGENGRWATNFSEIAYSDDEGQTWVKSGVKWGSWSYNTIFQLYAFKTQEPALFAQASVMLFIPDLFNYFLTGEKAAEYTAASTSGLLDATGGGWSAEIGSRLAFPASIFPEVRQPGTKLGPMLETVRSEVNAKPLSVVLTVSHDSASAVAALPAVGHDYAFISCGTWSIVGIERPDRIDSILGAHLSFTHEGSLDGKLRIVKNIMGLWLLQQCRKQWKREGEPLTYQEMQELAGTVNECDSYIDPDAHLFLLPSDMPAAIRRYCSSTGQRGPQSKAEIVRCVVESMALKYRQTIDELEHLQPERIDVVHMLGGGVNHRLLCQLTANAVGKPVIAGPSEATVMGNLLVQAMAHGEIANLSELRQVVGRSVSAVCYEPQQTEKWDVKYGTFLKRI